MKKKLLKNTEWTILIVSLLLFTIGLVALFSATQSAGYEEFKKQIQWFLISIPFLVCAYLIDYNVIARFSTVFYIVIIGLLIRGFVYNSNKWCNKLVSNWKCWNSAIRISKSNCSSIYFISLK